MDDIAKVFAAIKDVVGPRAAICFVLFIILAVLAIKAPPEVGALKPWLLLLPGTAFFSFLMFTVANLVSQQRSKAFTLVLVDIELDPGIENEINQLDALIITRLKLTTQVTLESMSETVRKHDMTAIGLTPPASDIVQSGLFWLGALSRSFPNQVVGVDGVFNSSGKTPAVVKPQDLPIFIRGKRNGV